MRGEPVSRSEDPTYRISRSEASRDRKIADSGLPAGVRAIFNRQYTEGQRRADRGHLEKENPEYKKRGG